VRWVPPSAFPGAIYHVYCRVARSEGTVPGLNGAERCQVSQSHNVSVPLEAKGSESAISPSLKIGIEGLVGETAFCWFPRRPPPPWKKPTIPPVEQASTAALFLDAEGPDRSGQRGRGPDSPKSLDKDSDSWIEFPILRSAGCGSTRARGIWAFSMQRSRKRSRPLKR